MGAMERLTADIHALPLDIGRIIVGGVLFVYFLNTFRQARDFSDPNGLIDHRLVCRLFPPTRVSLFQPGMPHQGQGCCSAASSSARALRRSWWSRASIPALPGRSSFWRRCPGAPPAPHGP